MSLETDIVDSLHHLILVAQDRGAKEVVMSLEDFTTMAHIIAKQEKELTNLRALLN